MTRQDANLPLHRKAIQALKAGDLKTGITLLQQALAVEPRSASLHNDLAAAYIHARQPRNALLHFAQAVSIEPGNVLMLRNYITILKKMQLSHKAEEVLVEAANSHPDNAAILSDLGALYATQHKKEMALPVLRKSLELDRSDEKTWARLISCMEAENMLGEASAMMAEARGLFPDSYEIALQAAKVLRRQKKTDEALRLLEKFIPESEKQRHGAFFYFELGQLYDLNDEADKAFAAFQQGNILKSRMTGPAVVQQGQVISRAIAHIRQNTQPPSSKSPHMPEGMITPAFIVGFPRSGTTLLEQIIASHPEASVAGEKPAVDAMLDRLATLHDKGKRSAAPFWQRPEYPACLEDLDDDGIQALRNAYYAEHRKHTDIKGRVFVDKSPLNMMHAPFIRRVFPEAKFILALRHPCDAVLSCFMQNFRANAFMSRFLSLEEAAKFYNEIFGLWYSFIPSIVPNTHESRYEDIVSDFRPPVEAALEYLGLPWDDAVLEYDRNAQKPGSIRTASYHQVTEKIYTRASGRWLKYRKHLEPVLPLLAPYAERAGYSLEEGE